MRVMSAADRHLVVDGSNIATEGRTVPSLRQLDEAVQAIMAERQFDSIIVIVDATFAHRIGASEGRSFEDAVNAGEIIMPPAGVVGRGDAFILQVADKAQAVVLSNDSFQEFHGEHDWLFDEGRLVGGKPIEHVGWVFVERVPVRGPASRRSVREAREAKSGSKKSARRSASPKPSKAASKPLGQPRTPPPRRRKGEKKPKAAKAETPRPSKKSKRETETSDSQQLNDPPTFLSFVTKHSIGDTVEGHVERFASHGCYVRASGAQCYLPSKAMGDPPPLKARDVVSQNQSVTVRVVSLDAERRGINVELISVGAVVGEGASRQPKKSVVGSAFADLSVGEAHHPRSKSHVATRKAAKKATKKAAKASGSAQVKKAAKKAPAKKAVKKKAPAKKASAKKAPARKAAKKAPARKAVKKGSARKTAEEGLCPEGRQEGSGKEASQESTSQESSEEGLCPEGRQEGSGKEASQESCEEGLCPEGRQEGSGKEASQEGSGKEGGKEGDPSALSQPAFEKAPVSGWGLLRFVGTSLNRHVGPIHFHDAQGWSFPSAGPAGS